MFSPLCLSASPESHPSVFFACRSPFFFPLPDPAFPLGLCSTLLHKDRRTFGFFSPLFPTRPVIPNLREFLSFTWQPSDWHLCSFFSHRKARFPFLSPPPSSTYSPFSSLIRREDENVSSLNITEEFSFLFPPRVSLFPENNNLVYL